MVCPSIERDTKRFEGNRLEVVDIDALLAERRSCVLGHEALNKVRSDGKLCKGIVGIRI